MIAQPLDIQHIDFSTDLDRRAQETILRAKSERTLEAEDLGRRQFFAWCQEMQVEAEPLTERTILWWCETMKVERKYAIASIKLKLWALRSLAGSEALDHSDVQLWLAGNRRDNRRPVKRAPAIAWAEIKQIIDAVRLAYPKLTALRTSMMLATMWQAGLRSSELANLNVEDVHFDTNGFGMRLSLWATKTSRDGEPVVKMIPCNAEPDYCPVRLMAEWIAALDVKSGPVLCALTPQRPGVEPVFERPLRGVSRHVPNLDIKEAAELVGMGERRFTSHSPRAGVATFIDSFGGTRAQIAEVTGHSPGSRALDLYIRRNKQWLDHPLAGKL